MTKENKPSHSSFFFLRSWSLFIATAWSRNEQSPARGCPCSLPLTSSHMGQLTKLFSWQQLFSGALPVSQETISFHFVENKLWFCKTEQTGPARSEREGESFSFAPELRVFSASCWVTRKYPGKFKDFLIHLGFLSEQQRDARTGSLFLSGKCPVMADTKAKKRIAQLGSFAFWGFRNEVDLSTPFFCNC